MSHLIPRRADGAHEGCWYIPICCWVLDPPDNIVKSCTLSMPDRSRLVDGLFHSTDSKLQVVMGVLVVFDATNGLHSGLLKTSDRELSDIVQISHGFHGFNFLNPHFKRNNDACLLSEQETQSKIGSVQRLLRAKEEATRSSSAEEATRKPFVRLPRPPHKPSKIGCVTVAEGHYGSHTPSHRTSRDPPEMGFYILPSHNQNGHVVAPQCLLAELWFFSFRDVAVCTT